MVENYISIIIGLIYIFVGLPIAFALNNKFNPENHKGFKYGFFLSVATIFNNIIYLIIIFYYSFLNQSYYYRTTTKDIMIFIFVVLLITVFHVFISILNGKKYKIGAILVSIFTGHFVISGFYFYNRWSELKKLPKMQNINIKNIENINNLNYKDILNYHSLTEYINLFEENRLIDINIITTLSENDYEKIGVKYLGDIKKLKSIFSESELIKNQIKYINISKKYNIIFNDNKENIINEDNNILLTIERSYYPTYAAVPIKIYVDEENVKNIENNSKIVYPLKNGFHTIYVKIDDYVRSEIINFNTDIKLNLSVLGISEIKLEEVNI